MTINTIISIITIFTKFSLPGTLKPLPHLAVLTIDKIMFAKIIIAIVAMFVSLSEAAWMSEYGSSSPYNSGYNSGYTSGDSTGMSGGAIAGIAIAGVAVVGIACAICYSRQVTFARLTLLAREPANEPGLFS